MGASNVKAVYSRWTALPDLPFRVLTYMALRAHDGIAPRYWGGREDLALAAGRPVPDAVRGNTAVAKQRRATFKAVDRVMDALAHAGAIVQTGSAYPGRNAEYAINLTGLAALFDGQALADPIDMTDRCGATKRDGQVCIARPKKGTGRCVAHPECTPVDGPNAPRSVDPMHPGERTYAPRSVDLMHPAHRGAKEEQDQQELFRTTSQEESLDLDTDPEVARAPVRPTKCPHGFRLRFRKDQTPDCALCRRESPCPAEPAASTPATPPAAHTRTAEPTDASADPNDSPHPTPAPSPSPWPTPSTTTAGPPQPRHPAASSPPAPVASPPPPPATDTPAAGSWPIVHIRQPDGRAPEPAELREDNPNRPTVVKVVYLASRTSAWVARTRVITPQENAA